MIKTLTQSITGTAALKLVIGNRVVAIHKLQCLQNPR